MPDFSDVTGEEFTPVDTVGVVTVLLEAILEVGTEVMDGTSFVDVEIASTLLVVSGEAEDALAPSRSSISAVILNGC